MNLLLATLALSVAITVATPLADTPCLKLRQDALKPLPRRFVYMPKCTASGKFEPKQCISQRCYCVEAVNGKPLKHYSSSRDTDAMDCQCARDEYYKMLTKSTKKFHCKPNGNYESQCETQQTMRSVILGKFTPKCESDGSFAPVQCFEVNCWCADASSGRTIGKYSITVGSKYTSMNCQCARDEQKAKLKDPKANFYCNGSGDYDTTCHIQQRKYKDQLAKYSPVCDKNGFYVPLQCSMSRCFCVHNFTGYQVADYQFKPTSALKKTDCQCAHDEEVYRSKGMCMTVRCLPNGRYETCKERQDKYKHGPYDPKVQKLTCDKSGNFTAKQCSKSGCICVNEHGNELRYYFVQASESKKMTCKCALDEDKFARTGLIGRSYDCDSLGNYRKNTTV